MLELTNPGKYRFKMVVYSIICLMMLSGCGTMRNGKLWADEASLMPGWDRVGSAAADSLLSPLTWLPAIGAGIMQIGNWDKKVSNWASRKTPVFGSQDSADKWSDRLVYISAASYGVTVMATPSGDKAGDWATDKIKGFIVGGAAFGVSEGMIEVSKSVVSRERPDGSDNKSFASAHSAGAASFATLSAKNIESMDLPRPVQVSADLGLGLLAVSDGWARIEAKKHYPSDVLSGLAIGHFFSALINDAYLKNSLNFVPEAEVSKNGVNVNINWQF